MEQLLNDSPPTNAPALLPVRHIALSMPQPPALTLAEQLSAITAQLAVLTSSSELAQNALPSAATPVSASPAPPRPLLPQDAVPYLPTAFLGMPPPSPFTGKDRSAAESVIQLAENVFDLNPAHFPPSLEIRKALYFSSYLAEDAHRWFSNLRATNSPLVHSWAAFRSAFLRDWDNHATSADAYSALLNLRQSTSVSNHTATFNSLCNRLPDAMAPTLLIAMYVNSLYDRHRNALSHVRINCYGGDGSWPSLLDVQTSARDLDVHTAQPPAYASALARSRALPVHQLSTAEFPFLPPSAPPSQPASLYTPSVASSTPSQLEVLLAQPSRPPIDERAERKARADAREIAGLCRYCGESGHKVNTCVALARKELAKSLVPASPRHPKA